VTADRDEGSTSDADLRVDVSDADVAAAKRAWVEARDRDLAGDRVAALHESYRRLVQTQAQQIALAFRARRERRQRCSREE